LEIYDGLVVLTSNLANNVNKAFARRFDPLIHFPMLVGWGEWWWKRSRCGRRRVAVMNSRQRTARFSRSVLGGLHHECSFAPALA
jgi:hypothetical protein